MTLLTVQTELQSINSALVTSAPNVMPGSIANSDLPMALVYPETAVHKPISTLSAQPDRDWVVRVYVMPIGLGTGIDEGFRDTMPILDSFLTEYEKLSNQRAGSHWEDLTLVSDDGVVIMTLHDARAEGLTRYWGTRIHLRIREVHSE